ncbi:hypothetical protein N473_24515 [Pseudoalteromonas luteoviolacea CPMOR-1]|uniref:Uncharacterized protein n=1 Tax=Pseudoalteromonas luteoviolacea CPMOR-1 TaxID=1365248 RepID=A0A167IVZ6_9GAMM|nr:hypothetical protein [Pseudoalteromonas luteoviolacea]KZN60145.1 hypothetical protein N473_24515 [Pseudoalteromonas luteoviolacea CPMOR-1]
MKSNRLIKLAFLSFTALSTQQTVAHQAPTVFDNDEYEIEKHLNLDIDCGEDANALQNALDKAYSAQVVQLTVSGECTAPLHIQHGRFEIINDVGSTGSIRVRHNQEYLQKSAILLSSSNVVFKNINIDVPSDMPAVELKANSVAKFNHISTNAKSPNDSSFLQFLIKDNSSAYFEKMSGNSVGVYGSSFVEFSKQSDQIKLEVYDTSAAQSAQNNHFRSVQVAGNGYFLGDNQSNVNLLMIWSKGAAEINNKSRVGEIMMGGQSHFAAYKESIVAGPYSLWGNVVFELEHSTAYNWKAVEKPYSIIIGNNAHVNGKLYPGWSWTGQAK